MNNDNNGVNQYTHENEESNIEKEVVIHNNNGETKVDTDNEQLQNIPNQSQPTVEAKPVINNQNTTGYQSFYNGVNNNKDRNISKNKAKKTDVIIVIAILLSIFLGAFALGKNKNFQKTNDKSQSENTFYADGYPLKYNNNWKIEKVKLTTGTESSALRYNNEQLYLRPVGISSLSSTEEYYGIDFATDSGKKKIHDEFYKNWNNQTQDPENDNTFSVLKDDIYYTLIKCDANTLNGYCYLIASEKNNTLISLIAEGNTKKNANEILKVIKTINITNTYNDELADMMSQMSAWNRYSSARNGELGTKKNINGGWKILSTSDAYWTFKDDEFYWYKSLNDLNDNYWYGKVDVLVGKKGLASVGLDPEKVDAIVAQSSGVVNEENIYTLILKPKKIISGGIDKSETNIGSEDWNLVWILVDHGTEGIEGQVLNTKTYDVSYYVKIKD